MLYIIYLSKVQGESLARRKIIKLIETYSKETCSENSIMCFPGYMSTADSSINEYLTKLYGIMNYGNNTINVGLFNGMNGRYNYNMTCSARDSHINKFGLAGSNNFNNIDVDASSKRDHRKMMCFFTYKKDFNDPIDQTNIDQFIDSISVNAVLIGSSNQSNTTYFDRRACKGEADIFIFRPDYYSEVDKQDKLLIREEDNDINRIFGEFEDSVITKSFWGKGSRDSEEFLKDILKSTLVESLN